MDMTSVPLKVHTVIKVFALQKVHMQENIWKYKYSDVLEIIH